MSDIFTPPPLTVEIHDLEREIIQSIEILNDRQDYPGARILKPMDKLEIIQASLEIEGNRLALPMIRSILAGKEEGIPGREVLEIKNTVLAYERLAQWDPYRLENLLEAHGILMRGLIDGAGFYRQEETGISRNGRILHVAPPAQRIPYLMEELIAFTRGLPCSQLIKGCVFHYEFEFIHPFSDGNGRLGRLWQTLFLSRWNDLFLKIHMEGAVRDRQQAYYRAFDAGERLPHSGPFLSFMLELILETLLDHI